MHTLSLGPLVLVATQDGPLLRVSVSTPTTADAGTLCLTIPEWSSLAAVADVLAAGERRHAEDAAEIKAFRESLMHACELRQATNDNERQLWAMWQTAARLSGRFSHERVQAKYDEYALDESPLHVARAEIDVLRQECRELTAQRDAARADMEAAEQRMLGVLDGTFAVGDGSAQREIERLRTQLDAARTAARKLAAMTKARDEACDALEMAAHKTPSHLTPVYLERATALRKVGTHD